MLSKISSDPAGFEAAWDRCAPWLEAALEHGAGTHDLSDVRALALDPESGVVFWAGDRSAIVTETIQHPRKRVLHFWLCGGNLRELVDVLRPQIEAWARSQGCDFITTAGVRTTWRRVLARHGYRPAWDILARIEK